MIDITTQTAVQVETYTNLSLLSMSLLYMSCEGTIFRVASLTILAVIAYSKVDCLYVNCEIPISCKAFTTDITGVCLFSGMNHHMLIQVMF